MGAGCEEGVGPSQVIELGGRWQGGMVPGSPNKCQTARTAAEYVSRPLKREWARARTQVGCPVA